MFVAQVYVVTLTLAFARRFAFGAATSSCSRKYTIKQGDFCDKISQEQHVSTYQLAATNPGLFCANLEVGKSICIGFVGKDCLTTHVVNVGDTCKEIASANGLDITIMRKNNPQLDQDCQIYVREVLCTSKTVLVHASVSRTGASASNLPTAVSKFTTKSSSTSFHVSPSKVSTPPSTSTITFDSGTSSSPPGVSTISIPPHP